MTPIHGIWTQSVTQTQPQIIKQQNQQQTYKTLQKGRKNTPKGHQHHTAKKCHLIHLYTFIKH